MTYTAYNMFQLYDIITDHEVEIRCPFSKDSLIKIIEDNNLDIDYDPYKTIYWYPSIIGFKGFNEYMICMEEDFNLREGDIMVDNEDYY